jgi:hypothetical protein
MDRIQELLGRITELSDQELTELRDLILTEIDGGGTEGASVDSVELSQLEELAEASTAVRSEFARRDEAKRKRSELAAKLAEFKSDANDKPAEEEKPASQDPEKTEAHNVAGGETGATVTQEADGGPVTAAAVPDDRKPQARPKGGATVITAGADLPGWAMGAEFQSADELARAMTKRIDTMRGIRGGDGDKMIVASAELQVDDDLRLVANDAEGNLRKVMAYASPEAIVAAGGLGAFRETRYDLFNMVGDTNRPVRDSLPVYRTDRGGVRFMRAPTINDINAVIGIWTVQNDIDAATNPAIRKPSFRVNPGPEVVVDTQAITMIMTFGNLMTRAYPELVRRHNELALVAQARVAEQQLLTQIGALSTAVTGRTQKVSAARELLLAVEQATAAYRNRHRINNNVPMRAIMPVWVQGLLRSDVLLTGDTLDNLNAADATINAWFRQRNINITWSMDGEAGQDYASMTKAGAGAGSTVGLAGFPSTIVWYLFTEGTFAFMDGGTLDLGLVRDSTLNAANDYQMFVETFENVVKFGNESYRVTSPLVPTGMSVSDKTYV